MEFDPGQASSGNRGATSTCGLVIYTAGMGFGGSFLLARWGERLDDVPLFADDDDPELVDEEPGTGWQLVQVSGDSDVGAELAAYTGGPVLEAYVNGSDVPAPGRGARPCGSGMSWSGVAGPVRGFALRPDAALGGGRTR